MTPEGKVKRKVSALLKRYHAYYTMPVPGGFGKQGLDYEGCHNGMFFAVETKRPGVKEPTDRQKNTIREIERAGGKTFVIDGDTSELERWLNRLENFS